MRQTRAGLRAADRNSQTPWPSIDWRDLNGNNDYDHGEVNLDPNGPDFVETARQPSSTTTVTEGRGEPEREAAQARRVLALARAGADREFCRPGHRGLHSRTTNINRIQNNLRPYEAYNIPVTNRDPGPDGEVGTADDGGLFTYYEFPELAAAPRFEEFMPINDPNADQSYKSIEVAAVKRLANRWQFMASYSATKKDHPHLFPTWQLHRTSTLGHRRRGLHIPTTRSTAPINTWDWDAKLLGRVHLPGRRDGVARTSTIRAATRSPGRCSSRAGVTIPDIVLNVEPIGSQRLPNLNLLTLRVEKSFRAADGAEAGGTTQSLQCAEREHGDSESQRDRATSSCGPGTSCRPASRRSARRTPSSTGTVASPSCAGAPCVPAWGPDQACAHCC